MPPPADIPLSSTQLALAVVLPLAFLALLTCGILALFKRRRDKPHREAMHMKRCVPEPFDTSILETAAVWKPIPSHSSSEASAIERSELGYNTRGPKEVPPMLQPGKLRLFPHQSMVITDTFKAELEDTSKSELPSDTDVILKPAPLRTGKKQSGDHVLMIQSAVVEGGGARHDSKSKRVSFDLSPVEDVEAEHKS